MTGRQKNTRSNCAVHSSHLFAFPHTSRYSPVTKFEKAFAIFPLYLEIFCTGLNIRTEAFPNHNANSSTHFIYIEILLAGNKNGKIFKQINTLDEELLAYDPQEKPQTVYCKTPIKLNRKLIIPILSPFSDGIRLLQGFCNEKSNEKYSK